MTDNKTDHPCAHPGCNCTVVEEEKWCRPHCETAPEFEAICGCGHEKCVAGAPVERAQMV